MEIIGYLFIWKLACEAPSRLNINISWRWKFLFREMEITDCLFIHL